MMEKVMLFGKSKSLVGIVTEPSSSGKNNLPAIILLNAGMLHRVGPNRLYVKMAREMAAAGFFVCRFDFSGIGDSGVRSDNLPFEMSAINETQEAMDSLCAAKNIDKFILMGLCSGAHVSLKAAFQDNRIIGVIMINGSPIIHRERMGMSPHIKHSIRERYYRGHVFNYRSWARFFTGKSDYQSIKKVLRNKVKGLLIRGGRKSLEKGFEDEWRLLIDRGVDIFLVYSEGSSALDAFNLIRKDEVRTLSSSGKLTIEVVQNTDHVFTLLWSQKVLMDLVHRWLQEGNRQWLSGKSTLQVG